MDVKIREAKDEEISPLADLWYDLATMHEEFMKGYELSENPKEAWKRFIRDRREKENMTTLVAVDEEEILGFVNVVIRKRLDFFKQQRIGMILDLFVREEFRGQGVGSKLVERSEEWIKDHGSSLGILTVAPENEDGVQFWEDHGYETYLLKKRKEL